MSWNYRRNFDRAAAMAAVNRKRRTRTRVLKLRRKTDPQHGTKAAYEKGCGCDACCAANTAYTRWRRKGAA